MQLTFFLLIDLLIGRSGTVQTSVDPRMSNYSFKLVFFGERCYSISGCRLRRELNRENKRSLTESFSKPRHLMGKPPIQFENDQLSHLANDF